MMKTMLSKLDNQDGSLLCECKFLYADFIIGLYTKDTLVIDIAISITIFLFFFQLFDSIYSILSGILPGFHETKIVFYVPILGYWFVGISLGFTLGLTDFITERMGNSRC
ncbi:MATE family efflux transporter [Xenorhabdus budapestensis]|uniref:MATE family efflux transporter n=1 Tax=Xenorhabdus budapestensis TaxID=290110 RepID=UPI003A8BD4F8